MKTISGLTWGFGFLYISEDWLFSQYLFCIFNSLQGFCIFLLNNAGKRALQNALSKFCCPAHQDSGGVQMIQLQGMHTAASQVLERQGIGKQMSVSVVDTIDTINVSTEDLNAWSLKIGWKWWAMKQGITSVIFIFLEQQYEKLIHDLKSSINIVEQRFVINTFNM